MNWIALFHEAFKAEFQMLDQSLQDELSAHIFLLQAYGSHLVAQR
jgi:hypothetical protein